MSYTAFPTVFVIPMDEGRVPFLPDFVAKTQNPSIPDGHFVEFFIPSLDDFMDGD